MTAKPQLEQHFEINERRWIQRFERDELIAHIAARRLAVSAVNAGNKLPRGETVQWPQAQISKAVLGDAEE